MIYGSLKGPWPAEVLTDIDTIISENDGNPIHGLNIISPFNIMLPDMLRLVFDVLKVSVLWLCIACMV